MRIHVIQNKMTYAQADTLYYFLHSLKNVIYAKVYDRTSDVVVQFVGGRDELIHELCRFQYHKTEVPAGVIENSGRELSNDYMDKLVTNVVLRYAGKLFIPYPIRAAWITIKAFRYIYKGLCSLKKGKLEVSMLDAVAISVSILRNDVKTASSIMFLLGIGELLEEWTHKKSVDDLARTMSLHVSRVWLKNEEQEVLVDASGIRCGDKIVVHMGNVIPFDGEVVDGEAMVNQSSLTGESIPVRKCTDSYVYAGTVLEEGEITLLVRETTGASRFEKIVAMIEESEKLKSSLESKAEHLADRLVPYTLAGTALTYFLTRNVTKAVSVLMVDFSCALKLAMPISVLSAIREASLYDIIVKGGKYLEAVAQADTIVFDKTGTLTKAQPTVAKVVPFCTETPEELLRIAACIEEHFPHSMAKAVVHAARDKGLVHEEKHSKVEYIVAHGISTALDGKRIVIGSHHFVFEDEKCVIPVEQQSNFDNLPEEFSHLYMAMDGKLAAVICIEDPLRAEADSVINSLRKNGISKVVMMTGDSERTARVIAEKLGVDEYYSEVLPEDKASYIENEKTQGRKVIMVGDGINDSPALSAADVGIAISDGAEIAREIADITIGADNLFEIVTLKAVSNGLMHRIHSNYRQIVGFNTVLILFGVSGLLQPTTSALLHNTSTLLIGLRSMQNIID